MKVTCQNEPHKAAHCCAPVGPEIHTLHHHLEPQQQQHLVYNKTGSAHGGTSAGQRHFS